MRKDGQNWIVIVQIRPPPVDEMARRPCQSSSSHFEVGTSKSKKFQQISPGNEKGFGGAHFVHLPPEKNPLACCGVCGQHDHRVHLAPGKKTQILHKMTDLVTHGDTYLGRK